MATLKQLLDSLSPKDRQLLNYAFEHQLPQFVRLADGRYIGVHTDTIKFLQADIKVGVWSTGRIKA